MLNRISLLIGIIALLLGSQNGYGYNTPYYFSGSSDLEVSGTIGSEYNFGRLVDEDTSFGGWSSGSLESTTQSLFVEFTAGVATIDKMQLLTGADPNYFPYHPKEFALFYTMDATVDINSNWVAMTNLDILNPEPEIVITNNTVFLDTDNTYITDEFLLSFDSVNATAIRIQFIQDFYNYGHPGVSVREISIDGIEAPASVPEPASLLLMGAAVIGLIRKHKCR